MRFLAFTPLQAALLALVTTGAIVALYFLKQRRHRVVIPSTLLWRRVLEDRIHNSIFEKLRRALSILLAVVIGLLVAMAIPRPEIEWLTGRTRPAVIVLDASPTMRARTADGGTRWQRALDRAQALIDGTTAETAFRIADTAGQFDSSFTPDRSELRRLLERMQPATASTRFPDMESASEADAPRVYFITDNVFPLDVPDGVETISVFESAPNVGITAFEIRSMPSSPLAYEAYLEVANFGAEARTVEVIVSGAGQERIVRNVPIPPGQTFRDALDLSQFEGGGIRAAVRSDGDAFALDDSAYAYLPVKRRSRTLLVTQGNTLLETLLRLHRLIDLSVTTPAGYTGAEDFDAVVFDRFAPPEPPGRPALIVGAQNVSWLRRPTGSATRPRFDTWMEDHPVMRLVSLYDVEITTASRVDAQDLIVLASSGNVPLIVASERPRWIMLTFDLRASDFPYHAGFPVFVDNAIAWFGRERLALRRIPGSVEVPVAEAQIRTIDGRDIPSRQHMGETVFEASEPGLYVASQGDARQYVAVNFTDRRYSDINRSSGAETTAFLAGAPLFQRGLWFYMLIAAIVLVSAEWFTYHRRITQ